MLSAAQDIASEWDPIHHLHHHYYGHHDHDPHPIEDNPQLKLSPDGKVTYKDHGKTHDQVIMTRKKRPTTTGKADMGLSDENRLIPRVCVDCKTSKTPLWRSGPAGPKSLCNACGIRHRKRRRGDILGAEGNVAMKEKQRKEKVLFLLERKFPGREDAEAAVLLMALSCGLFVHT